MKKIILVVLLAVVASRALHDRRERRGERATDPAEIIRTAFWDDDDRPAPPEPPRPPVPPEPPAPPRHKRTKRETRREVVRVETATAPKVAPAWFPKSDWEEEGLAQPDESGARVLVGRVSVSEERAKTDLRKTLHHEIADWLAADVPMTWTPPDKLVDRMVLDTYVGTVTRGFRPSTAAAGLAEVGPAATVAGAAADLGSQFTLYRAGQKLDFSEDRRADFVRRYHRDVASGRMRRSGAVLAVVLVSLALFSAYVRTDEATKGYYTNRLRTLAVVGLGAAGAVAYHYWA